MPLFDLALLIIIGGFVFYGLWSGLIHALGSLVGVVVGSFIAGRLFEPLSHTFGWAFGGNANLARIVIFFLIFTIVNRLVGFAFHIADRGFRFITIIPFLSSINRLAGAVLGFLEGSLVIGGALYLATKFPLDPAFTAAMAKLQFAGYFLGMAAVIIPLLPDLVVKIESALPKKML
jgi:uncharacterized membrane protein required for colicin V production